MNNFFTLCEEWKNWSENADKSEEGWQSNFPKWDKLMSIAEKTMLTSNISEEIIEGLELCWLISEETEDLCDFAKDNILECYSVLEQLLKSKFGEVRWQVYSAISFAGNRSEKHLRAGLKDSDNYCKRRAILSLAKLKPHDSKELTEKFIKNSDQYIRCAAIEMAFSSDDIDFIKKIKLILLNDENKYVVKAAEKIRL